MGVKIHTGDCRTVLSSLADESVHCCVTSPPYWGLRDYGVDGQLGLEPDFNAYVSEMVTVFREVRRVLRNDGTLWLNLGDSYARDPGKGDRADYLGLHKNIRDSGCHTASQIRGLGVLKPKDLCGIPWRVAFALQADGWWLRQDIIWSKPNPMPESITDRCTKAHEYLFLLSKSERYFYDAEAIKEEAVLDGIPQTFARPSRAARSFGNPSGSELHGDRIHIANGRNKRSVWEIATAPFSEAHFATFPPALIEPCIKAGCPQGGTVLDPFGGAGTTGLVADRLGRNAVLIELNPQYVAMAEQRIRGDAPLFVELSSA